MKKLLVNAVLTPDGTRIDSNHRHDYRSHKDANGETYSVDGGLDYVRRSVNNVPATDLCVYSNDPHSKIRMVFKWGTRGKTGKDPLTWLPLYLMETSHILAILETQKHIGSHIEKVFRDELQHRENQNN